MTRTQNGDVDTIGDAHAHAVASDHPASGFARELGSLGLVAA
jgi:hypothetical protein